MSACALICSTYASTNIETLKKYWIENNARLSRFSETSQLKGLMMETVTIDSDNQLFYIGKIDKLKRKPIIYLFSEVNEYEFKEVGGKVITKSKGGFGRAVVGGVLFGGVGAIVGASTSKKESKTVGGTTFLNIKFYTHAGKKTVIMSNPPIGITQFLDKCIDEFDIQPTYQSASAADEIDKFNQLMKQGIITPEEFEAKKKQLLKL